MKHGIAVLCLLSILFLAQGCSEEAPSLRVRNDFSKKVNVQCKPAAGATLNINDVAGGTSSVFQDVAETTFSASASVQGESSAPTAVFTTKNKYRYTIVITNTVPPEMKVETEER